MDEADKNAIFENLGRASQRLREAYRNLDAPFSRGQINKMIGAMRDDPSGESLRNLIPDLAFTDKQREAAEAVLENYVGAYSVRSIPGFGQSSDELRGAIKATLPGPSVPLDYALKQLDAYDALRDRISRRTPNPHGRQKEKDILRNIIAGQEKEIADLRDQVEALTFVLAARDEKPAAAEPEPSSEHPKGANCGILSLGKF